MSPVVWVLLLLALGLSVMVLEVFVPSGGVLGFVSIMAIIAAVATAFLQIGAVAGGTVLAVVVVTVPVLLGLAFRWFPETSLGRRVLPPPPEGIDVMPRAEERKRRRDLIGAVGRVVSDLLPWGTVAIGGEDLEAMSEAGPIAPGTDVQVVGVQGLAVIVRPLAPAAAAPRAASPPAADPGAGESTAVPPGERLSSTLETFEFDHFRSPGA
ncbi:MAG: NfeD family protein [Pirellulales bacterium]|jgi:membrane-bound ClpP family serine protease